MKNNFNLKEYSNYCAKLLGYLNTTPTDPDFNIYENKNGFVIDGKQYTMLETMSMKFHSDWNWIHEVIEKINDTPIEDGFIECIEAKYLIFQRLGKTHKSAVVEAIWQFLQWYNQNKSNLNPEK
jgi:hypothetical protein